MKAPQLGSLGILMPTSRIVEPNPITGVISGKAPFTEPSWVQVLSSSSEEHGYYSGKEVDFGDKPALPDTSKFSHISEEETQAYILAIVSSSGEVTTAEDIFSILLNYFPIKLGRYFNTLFESLL